MLLYMKPSFKYLSEQDLKVEYGLLRALWLIQKERIIIDAHYIPVLELAERGDFFAQCEMQEAFASGTQGVPKHYGLARRYTDMIMEFNRGKVVPEVEALRNSAKLELGVGNIEVAKQELVQAAKLMTNNLPSEKWDFDIFSSIQKLITQGQNHEDEF
jgi:hypothetical protein